MQNAPATCGHPPEPDAPFALRECNTPIDLTKLPALLDACPGADDPQ
jgi:hypothetical protein